MGRQCAVHMEDVTFRYFENGKRNILDHMDLDIEEGGITVIMGSSGCGKSTLAAVASGLYPENGGFLASGRIELFGIPLTQLDPQSRAAYMTLMFQNADLQFCMDTLRAEMRFCLENICVPKEAMASRIRQAADTIGVTPLLDRRLETLSGGEKQLAALACLFVMDSRCIVLDEVFANIDPVSAGELVPVLRRIADAGKTVIAIDHRLDYWLEAADEIIILTAGGKTAARGISKANLDEYRPVFAREGLFCPGSEAAAAPHAGRSDGLPAIELEHVSIYAQPPVRKLFRPPVQPGPPLLEDASVTIRSGAMTALVGRSGSGKTTTFLSVLKQHPYTGNIKLFGTDLAGISRKELYRQAGIVFQNPANQFITQNVLEEVTESIRVWDRTITEDALTQKAEALLADFGLSACKKYSPYMLSQGQQRRLAVLAVLCGGQQLLLLDEPTYGQDQRSVHAIMQQLRLLMQKRDLTVVFITHDLALARQWADDILELKGGRLRREEAQT